MKERIVFSLSIVTFLSILLFVNILTLDFSNRILSFYIQWALIFFIILFSIDLIFFKLAKWNALLFLVCLTIILRMYFLRTNDLKLESQRIYFNERREEVNELIRFVNREYAAGRNINEDSLESVIEGLGFEGIQVKRDCIALKVKPGFNGIKGFIYISNPRRRIFFGQYITPGKHIEGNWYSFN